MLIPLLIAAMATHSELAPPVLHEPDPVLAGYLIEAADNHPALAQRYEEWRAALEVIPQVTSLDDPMFRYGQFIRSSMGRAEFELMQKFPWFGTLAAKGDAATAEAEAALQRFFAERDTVFYGVRRWYREYQWLGDQLRVIESQQTVVDYVADLVEAKLSLGLATDAEWYRINIASTQLQDQFDGLHEQIPAVAAALAAAMGRRGGESVPLPLPERSGLPPEPPDMESVHDRIASVNPSLRIADHRIESLRYQEVLARKRGRPEFTIGLEYMLNRRDRSMVGGQPTLETLAAANRLGQVAAGQMAPMPIDILMDANMVNMARREAGRQEGPRDNLMLSVTVSLPIYRERVRAGVNEARAMQRAVQHEREAQLLELEAAAAQAHFRMRDGSRRFAVHEVSLLPQAELTIESIGEKYAADAFGVSFIDVVESTQLLLEFELEKARALREWRMGEAELLLLTSGELPRYDENARAEIEPTTPYLPLIEAEIPLIEAEEAAE